MNKFSIYKSMTGWIAGCLFFINAGHTIEFKHHILDKEIYALGIDATDLHESGRSDIVACDASGIYRYSNGNKSIIDRFNEPTLFILLRTGDIDLDGDYDVVAVDHRNGNIWYYENPGQEKRDSSSWPRHLIDDRTEGAHALVLADINCDGRLDVIASGEAEADPANSIVWLECPPDPNRAERWNKHIMGLNQSGGLAHYPSIGDVNRDGRIDVVHAAKQGEWFRLWLQPEKPTDPWEFNEIGKNYIQATNIQVGDVNGDGIADLVGTQGHHVGVLWFEGPDWTPHYIDQTLKSPHTLVVADLDRDNDLDIATCAFESKILCWFENDGKSNFTKHVISTDQAAYDLVARDIDADGDLDLLVAGQESNTVSWYEQVGHPNTLRVITYNIHHAEGLDRRVDTFRIAEFIRQTNADIVALQEVDRHTERIDQRDSLLELAQWTRMNVSFGKNIDHQGGDYGNALLSRFPIQSSQNIKLPRIDEGEQRGLLETIVDAHGTEIRILNTHLDHRGSDDERIAGCKEIVRFLETGKSMPTIVCGDMNATPGSEPLRILTNVLLDAWSTAGDGNGYTIPVHQPNRRIDYILYQPTGSLRPMHAFVSHGIASDHLPVFCEFQLFK